MCNSKFYFERVTLWISGQVFGDSGYFTANSPPPHTDWRFCVRHRTLASVQFKHWGHPPKKNPPWVGGDNLASVWFKLCRRQSRGEFAVNLYSLAFAQSFYNFQWKTRCFNIMDMNKRLDLFFVLRILMKKLHWYFRKFTWTFRFNLEFRIQSFSIIILFYVIWLLRYWILRDIKKIIHCFGRAFIKQIFYFQLEWDNTENKLRYLLVFWRIGANERRISFFFLKKGDIDNAIFSEK